MTKTKKNDEFQEESGRLTLQQKKDIAIELIGDTKSAVSYRSIAKRYKTSKSTIERIKKKFKHVPKYAE